jgi:hypothetical protein
VEKDEKGDKVIKERKKMGVRLRKKSFPVEFKEAFTVVKT